MHQVGTAHKARRSGQRPAGWATEQDGAAASKADILAHTTFLQFRRLTGGSERLQEAPEAQAAMALAALPPAPLPRCTVAHSRPRAPLRLHARRRAAQLRVAAVAGGSAPPVTLQLAAGTQVAMPTSTLVLGSAAEADLQLEGSGVAAQHARLGAVGESLDCDAVEQKPGAWVQRTCRLPLSEAYVTSCPTRPAVQSGRVAACSAPPCPPIQTFCWHPQTAGWTEWSCGRGSPIWWPPDPSWRWARRTTASPFPSRRAAAAPWPKC